MTKVRLAVIRIRGDVNLSSDVRTTLKYLKIYRKNYCSLWPSTPQILGMIQKVKDFVTFGEIDEETCKLLLEKRGRLAGNKPLNDEYVKSKTGMDLKEFSKKYINFAAELKDIPGLKTFFRLCPPRGGFERKGIKASFAQGGALGYRGKNINDLLKRMV
ncbi:MAG: 50S ribosomal protein L30 [Candidatus Nanoarchaeia archaeon]